MNVPASPERVISPARWRQLEPLLDHALDLDAPARLRFLDDLSVASMELRTDLEWFLHQQQTGEGVRRVVESDPGPEASASGRTQPRRGFIGRRIGPFLLTERIGAGGMGAVYRGERVEGGFRQTVAIKLIHGSHPEIVERFARERQILAELRHPRIAQLLDGGETSDGLPYFTMEYVGGQNLAEHADAIGADIDARVQLLLQVGEGLAHAHRQQVLHRDIKPSNIVVCADGQVKLLDFGIARLLAGTDQTALTIDQVGPMTPDYAAPEQFTGAPLTVATDIYQFGTLAFRLITGRLPLQAANSGAYTWGRAVAEQPPMTLAEALREARQGSQLVPMADAGQRFRLRRPAELQCVFDRMLAKQPQDRYQDMPAVLADLEAWLQGRAVAARPLPGQRRWPMLAALVALLLLAVALMTFDRLPLGGAGDGDWQTRPALAAFGMQADNLHVAHAETETLLREALLKDAAGDRPGALALLETAHASDPQTPIPAMLLGYWGVGLGVVGDAERWFRLAGERVAATEDPVLDLLLKFLQADSSGQSEQALRYSGALLQLRPGAWFLRLARAHHLGGRGLREAATLELAAIDVGELDHRKLVDAIADRASYGDLAGAQAQFARLPPAPDDPKYLDLKARLTYSAGDLAGARAAYVDVVRNARRLARFDLEGRALLYAGVLSGSLGERAEAADWLQQAQRRLGEREQNIYATDASLALAQLADLSGDRPALLRHLAAAQRLASRSGNPSTELFNALFQARLGRSGDDGSTSAELPELPDVPESEAVRRLLLAHRHLREGEHDQARGSLRAARQLGIEDGAFAEEVALLARQLDEPLPELRPIDPPFAPYGRFAARWALGIGASVVPRPQGGH